MRLRILACLILIMSMLGTQAACTSSSSTSSSRPSSSSVASCATPAAKPTSSTSGAIDLAAIVKDVGKTSTAISGTHGRQVIVIQERHDSRAVQVEIAIMLERLYRDYGLRDLALEGAVTENGDPTPGNFYQLPDACTRTEVALYLLRQGEISGAEFMAMAHPDFHLHAIEDSSQYSVNESPAEQQALSTYVSAIGKQSLTAKQANDFNHLLGQLAPADGSTPPAEVIPTIIDGLVALARQVNLNMGAAAQAIQQDRTFWIVTAQRSVTMVNNTVTALSGIPNGLIVLDIGAAHTHGVVRLLQGRGVSTSVLSPASLPTDQQHGDFTQAEYDRKQAGHLVGSPGTLGALLEQGHNSPPILGYGPFQAESAIMYAADQVMLVAAGGPTGPPPPFPPTPTTLGLGDFNPIDIPPGQISIIQQKPKKPLLITMPVRVKATGQVFWVAMWQVAPDTPIPQDAKTLERALFEVLKVIQAEPDPNHRRTVISVRMGSEVMGVIGTDKKAAIAAAQAAIKSS
jgi:hypothetical protein